MTFHTLRQDTGRHAMIMASGDPPKAVFFRQDAIVIACEGPFSLNRVIEHVPAAFFPRRLQFNSGEAVCDSHGGCGGGAQREQQFSDADWGQSSRRDPARVR
jgi:hypothetical protein